MRRHDENELDWIIRLCKYKHGYVPKCRKNENMLEYLKKYDFDETIEMKVSRLKREID